MALDFNPLDFFREELQNDKAEVRINAINQLHLIASALGPQKTVTDLLPYLQTVLESDPFQNDDELLFNLAKQYAVLGDFIDNDKRSELIKPLEHLAAQEETVIREQAIESMEKILSKASEGPGDVTDLYRDFVVPALHRLATKTDFFTARVSACALFPTVYKGANADQRAELRKAYQTLCSDDTPMVRRAAANKMSSFVNVISKDDVLRDMMDPYKQLAHEDTQDTIRVASVHTTLVIAGLLNAEENERHTVSVIKDAGEDRSWRVRLIIARKFDELCKAFGPDLTNQHLIKVLCVLMKDHEQEVRKESVKIIERCIADKNDAKADLALITNEQLVRDIVPLFAQIGMDPSQPVRAALATVLGPVSKALGLAETQKCLLPLISDLLKDEFHDVRLNMVSHAGLLCEVLGVDGLVHHLLSTIQALIMDNHWRIRQSVVEQVPQLAKLFGVDMFQSKLEALFLSSLRDSVHSVRTSAIENIERIAVHFGAQWTVEHLMPKIIEQYQQNTGYANRVTTLNALPKMSVVMSEQQISSYIVSFVAKATKDGVPNVRFQACKTILWLLQNKKLMKKDIDATIKQSLLELKEDSDSDVQYFSQQALQFC